MSVIITVTKKYNIHDGADILCIKNGQIINEIEDIIYCYHVDDNGKFVKDKGIAGYITPFISFDSPFDIEIINKNNNITLQHVELLAESNPTDDVTFVAKGLIDNE